MKLTFEITADDVIAFNRHHTATLLQGEGFLPRFVGAASVAASLFGLYYVMASGRRISDLEFWIVVGAAVPVMGLWMAIAPWLVRWQRDRVMYAYLRDPLNFQVLGWWELELVGDRLICRTDYTQAILDMSAIGPLIDQENRTFLCVGGLGTLVIPRREREDEYDEFIAALRQRWESRPAAGKPADARPIDERIQGSANTP